MGLKVIDIIAALAINMIQIVHTLQVGTDAILSCNSSMESCPRNQLCNLSSLECECLQGYVREGVDCLPHDKDSESYDSTTAVVVSIFMLALLGCGLFLVIKKYHLVDYVRDRINARRNNDVMYEDVMIGNDDPPLSP